MKRGLRKVLGRGTQPLSEQTGLSAYNLAEVSGYRFAQHRETGLLLREEETFQRFMAPRYWLFRHSEDLSPFDVLGEMQKVLHELVEGFLNSSFSLRADEGKFLRRLPHRRLSVHGLLEDLARLATVGAETGLCFNSLASLLRKMIQKPRLSDRDMASALVKAYACWLQALDRSAPIEGGDMSVNVPPLVEHAEYRRRGLDSIVMLADYAEQRLRPYVRAFVLHGSMSTLDYTPFSDVDTWLIVSADTMQSVESLLSLRGHLRRALRFLYQRDLTQHHDFMIVTEMDCWWYPSYFFPPILLEYSKSLCTTRCQDLTFSLRPDALERQSAFWASCHFLRRACSQKNGGRDLYSFKYWLSVLMLLPTFFLQLQGQMGYKKFSFQKAQKVVLTDWSAMDRASLIRANWPGDGILERSAKLLFHGSNWVDPRSMQYCYRVICSRAGMCLPDSIPAVTPHDELYTNGLILGEKLLDWAYANGFLPSS